MPAGERLVLDAIGEDSANSPLELSSSSDSDGIILLEHSYPPPALDARYAASADSEGDGLAGFRYRNREIELKVRAAEPQDIAAANYVPNPSFETGLSGWATIGGTPSQSSLHAEAGDYSAKIAGTASGHGISYQELSVTNGQRYYFRCVVYVEDIPAASSATIRILNASDVQKAIATSTAAAQGRIELSGTFVADADSGDWRVSLLTSGGAGTYTLYYDAVIVATAPNLENGGFEDGLTGWTTIGGTPSQSGAHAEKGTYSGRIDGTGSGHGVSSPISVETGVEYVFGAIVYVTTIPAASQATIRIVDSAGNQQAVASSTAATTGRFELSGTFTADQTVDDWTVRLLTLGGAGTYELYFDEVYVAERWASGQTSPYFDGDTPGCDWTGTHHGSDSTRPGDRFYAILSDLQKKVGKITREGGTLRRIPPNGEAITFDLLEASLDIPADKRFMHRQAADIPLKLVAKPFGRGAPVTLSDHAETTLPHLVFTETGIKGDVPALGKLVIDEDDADDQAFLKWAIQSRYYDSAATAALFFEAEGRTAQGGAAIATRSGASGGGSNNVIRQATLTPSYQSMLSTQTVSAGAHLSNVGSFDVWARVYDPNSEQGRVKLRLEWAEGDFRRRTLNAEVTPPVVSDFSLVPLGQVHLTKAVQGTQRWEGRILAKSSTVGDDVDIDCLFLFPTTEGSGEAKVVQQFETPSSFSALDGFDQSAGALTGKTLPVGGTWAGAGDADDFQVETTGKTAQRTAVSDADNIGRICTASTPTLTAAAVQVDFKNSAANGDASDLGAVARYTDTNNYFYARLSTGTIPQLQVAKKVAGSEAVFAELPVSYPAGTFYSIRLVVDARGRFWVWYWRTGSAAPGSPVVVGQHADLATGGTLASGKVGIHDLRNAATASTRNYDNFLAFGPTPDAAVFASQSLELRHDRVIREDSSGSFWTPVSKYEGDYLLIPPSGREDRTVRIMVKASRNDPDTSGDSAIDDQSARLTYTPRWLVVPEPV